PARDLAVLLFQMTEHGEGAAAYYADMTQAVLSMATCAPGGPPGSAAEFLARLDPGWLEAAYGAGTPGELTALRATRPHAGCWTALRVPMAGGYSGTGDADAGVAAGRLAVFSLAAAPCR